MRNPNPTKSVPFSADSTWADSGTAGGLVIETGDKSTTLTPAQGEVARAILADDTALLAAVAAGAIVVPVGVRGRKPRPRASVASRLAAIAAAEAEAKASAKAAKAAAKAAKANASA